MSINMRVIARGGRSQRATPTRHRGIGHFAAIALSAAAAVGFFMILYPVAKSMMSQTVASMQSVQQQVLNSTICSSSNCS
ncbi:hypothetical protein [Alicyclobacillus sendaiensis]|uniref:Uncharacterized protein n=1 Tax=Alicyclobacillus sendaiensis PA2 TaxID=3029425 RepID=A0ABT6Y150_ALISE|nr:hypothetical protein [Alicyclobacillus sendaiensis]MDI9261066.1 hypothetical protein [Alicyclobacillus sendaiensis PA2]